MFGIGWAEMLVILIVAAMVIGPRDMPRALHAAGKLFRKFRAFTGDIQQSFERIMREEDLNEIIREANKPGGEDVETTASRQYALEQARLQSEIERAEDGGDDVLEKERRPND
jgi:sec-independent protein translocase protein TatB